MPDDPARPFGRDILKLRALFVPEGAADSGFHGRRMGEPLWSVGAAC